MSCAATGAIAPSTTRTLTLSGVVLRAAAETPQQNVATVAGSQLDPDLSNNSSSVTTTVNAAADLAVTKTVDRATANVGDTLTWTVAVQNTGPSTATGVMLIDDLPAGTTYLGSTPSAGSCGLVGSQLSCGPVALASGRCSAPRSRRASLGPLPNRP